MTGKEALYNIELARITEYKKDGIYTKDIRDTTEYRVIKYELDELTKYKRAFEILKDNFFIDLIERQEDWKLGFEPINPIEGQPRFSQLPKEEAELLEELMKGEEIR